MRTDFASAAEAHPDLAAQNGPEIEDPEEVEQATIRQNEPDLLEGLLAAAQVDPSERIRIEIERKGRVLFSFSITPLGEEQYQEARNLSTSRESSRQLGGIKIPVETDVAEYHARLIYFATTREDRPKTWDHPGVYQKYLRSGHEAVQFLLRAGEVDAIVAKIDAISGYGKDLEGAAKN
jgi:hypothetical protein